MQLTSGMAILLLGKRLVLKPAYRFELHNRRSARPKNPPRLTEDEPAAGKGDREDPALT